MKKGIMFLIVFVLALGLSMQADAALELRGVDNQGNRLIYDTDFDITWYDYTESYNTWQNQVNWADTLSVSGGDLAGAYDDWRLPSTVDGPYSFGYDGTTTAGYNITSSEIGHLFYTELGNDGWYDTSGNLTGCSSSSPYCLTNTGDFQNLLLYVYWSGTEYSDNTDGAWLFYTASGDQAPDDKGGDGLAIAVRPGDVSVAVVPEPMSMILFGVGGVVLAGRRKLLRRRG